MRTSTKKPIIWPVLKAFFPAAEWGSVIVTFGRTTHCASELSISLKAHEQVHQHQQGMNPVTATLWWIRYILSSDFRFDQELEAHRAEYDAVCEMHSSRDKRALHLEGIARRLSGPLYNNMRSFGEAVVLIRNRKPWR